MYKQYYEMLMDFVFRLGSYPQAVSFYKCKYKHILKSEQIQNMQHFRSKEFSDKGFSTVVDINVY